MTYISIALKRALLCAGMATLFTTGINAQIFVSEDFNSASSPGLPTGWTSLPSLFWATGAPNTVTPNAMVGLQYSLNDAAHMKAVGIDGTQASADAAIIASPAVSLPNSATNAIVKFDVAFFGIQSNNTPPQTESLVFIVSTDGGTTWSDVGFVMPAGNPATNPWETQSFPMSAYAGQSNLKFGFRYNNQGGTLIGAALDNIRLVNGTDGSVTSAFAGDHPDPPTGTGYQLIGSGTMLTGTVQNTGATNINSYYIRYQVGTGSIQSSGLITTPLAPLATHTFPSGLPVAVPASASYTIKVWIEATGDIDHSNDTFTTTIVGVPYFPVKRPVFEEGTGTWCGWCPRGAVFMDHFAASHPGGAASQIAVHNSDPMTLNTYDNYMKNYAGGFPNIVVDRFSVKDPRYIDTAFAVAQNNFGFADISLGSPIINGSNVSIPVTVQPVVTISNPKLALVVTESNLVGSGPNWPQNNYYSGGGSGIMGGWEGEASHVSSVNFHFTARSITPSPDGGLGNLPSTIAAGNIYHDTLTTALDGTWKANDLQYVVLLLNGDNTSVMNSAATALPNLQPTLPGSTSLTEIGSDIEQALLYPNPASGKSYLKVRVKNAGQAKLAIMDIAGRKLYESLQQVHSGDNTFEVTTKDLTAGTYFVNLITDKGSILLNLLVIK